MRYWSLLPLLALDACQSYQPSPLRSSPDVLAAPHRAAVARAAASIDRPFLRPATIHLAAPLDTNAIATIAVIANPDLKALVGLTMVVGMVTELVIFFLAEVRLDAPIDIGGLREAGATRLRRILMPAVIAVLTLAPLALGVGRGSGLNRPTAKTVMFGLTAAAPLVLLFLPAALLVLGRRGAGFRTA